MGKKAKKKAAERRVDTSVASRGTSTDQGIGDDEPDPEDVGRVRVREPHQAASFVDMARRLPDYHLNRSEQVVNTKSID
ncbi:MAG: hypothetical protein AAGG01_17210, partial [Planctomycetota bacterium]